MTSLQALPQLKISFTGAGAAFVVALVPMLLVAINYQNSLAYALCFWLLSLIGVTAWQTYKHLRGVQVVFLESAPVFVGEQARFRFSVSPTSRQALSATWWDAAERGELPIDLHEDQGVLILPAAQRGWLNSLPVRLESTFPLGFFKAQLTLTLQGRVLVYPHPISAPWGELSAGSSQSKMTQQGIGDYQGVRAWRSGESMQRLDWKAFSRDQGFWVKHFLEPLTEPDVLSFEALQGSTERRLSILCDGVLRAAQAQKPFVLGLPHAQLGPAIGSQHQARCLQALALYGQGQGSVP